MGLGGCGRGEVHKFLLDRSYTPLEIGEEGTDHGGGELGLRGLPEGMQELAPAEGDLLAIPVALQVKQALMLLGSEVEEHFMARLNLFPQPIVGLRLGYALGALGYGRTKGVVRRAHADQVTLGLGRVQGGLGGGDLVPGVGYRCPGAASIMRGQAAEEFLLAGGPGTDLMQQAEAFRVLLGSPVVGSKLGRDVLAGLAGERTRAGGDLAILIVRNPSGAFAAMHPAEIAA